MNKKHFDDYNSSEIPSNVKINLRDLKNDGHEDEYSGYSNSYYLEDYQDEINSGIS